MRRFLRHFLLIAAFAVVFSATAPVSAQLPVSPQELVQALSGMTPAQRQSIVNSMSQAQRAELLNLLQPQVGTAQTQSVPAATNTGSELLAAEIARSLEPEDPTPALGPGDTLIANFGLPEDATEELVALRSRLARGNPYQLDQNGRLNLPSIPSIALAGLDTQEATARLRAEFDLKPFDISLIYLPLQPVGSDALTRFGYGLFRDAPSTFAPPTNIPVPVDYVIGPGDALDVQLFGVTNAAYTFPVDPDGTINFPGFGPISVAGLELSDVRALISARVEDAMTGTSATTTLAELRSISVFVTGDVTRAGLYTISSLSTITNALFASGGVSNIGSLRRIALRRAGATIGTLDLYDLLLRGDTGDDARLQQLDVVFVPPVGATVSIDGEVRRPAIYELNGEESIDDLIALAGGLNANADLAAVTLERIVPGSGFSVTNMDLAAAEARSTAIRDGDILRIEPNLDQLEGSVRLVGNVQRPGIHQWREGMTLSDLLPSSEFVRPLSDLNYVLIRREQGPNIDVDALSVDLQAVWESRPGAVDLALEPRDTVYVFQLETGRQQYVQPIIDELEAQLEPNESLPVVSIRGQVRAIGEYPLEPGMRLSDLLRAGGGLTDAAYTVEAELTRYTVIDGEYREPAIVDVVLDDVLRGDRSADILLAPYDSLHVKVISGWRDESEITLQGEFSFPGIYTLRPGETLSSVLARAGGLTDLAHAEASVFTRVELQQREQTQLQSLMQRLQSEITSEALANDSGSENLATARTLFDQLEQAQATGRLVIRLDELLAGNLENDIVLRDGDQLIVPPLLQEVTVIGEVQYQTSHTFNRNLSRDDYIERSGGLTERADKRRIYVVRANGEVVVDTGGRWFRRDMGTEITTGDTVVVPLKIDRLKPLSLWSTVTQVIYNMAIAVAAVNSF